MGRPGPQRARRGPLHALRPAHHLPRDGRAGPARAPAANGRRRGCRAAGVVPRERRAVRPDGLCRPLGGSAGGANARRRRSEATARGQRVRGVDRRRGAHSCPRGGARRHGRRPGSTGDRGLRAVRRREPRRDAALRQGRKAPGLRLRPRRFRRRLRIVLLPQVVKAVADIAHGLGKQTIAEFVGDDDTISLLRDSGVDLAQGYHLGRPAPADELV
jgi:hypothetical protein